MHSHEERLGHKWNRITVPEEYNLSNHGGAAPRHYMELFAVLCIETSHYVAFVKCGVGSHTPWCFFDSMADRKGSYFDNTPVLAKPPRVKSYECETWQQCRHGLT